MSVTSRCAFGWSTFRPSINQRYCCSVNSRASFSLRGLIHALLQALIQQQKTVALPVECFDAVPLPAAKQEQRIAERIQLKLLPHKLCKTVDATAKVCVTAGDIDTVRTTEVTQHGSVPGAAL